MSTESFEKSSWGWQLSLVQQQVSEWLEYQSSRWQRNLPQLPDGWSMSPWLQDLLTITFWLLLGLFLAWIVWRLWQEFSPYIYPWLAAVGNSGMITPKAAETKISTDDLLLRAQELAQLGNYGEACRCLYLAMLQQLDQGKVILAQASRTDGEYLQLLRSTVTTMQAYETIIITHEQLCFGQTKIGAENYQQCRQAYGEIFP
ncbi:hypothetical protein B6N60_02953 [Richelia sinica FACHB-800]|uniref:Protein-glutamine gamma-glutamyltransferase-like C-terminal domain-containing protein n=1 Tax=Richelia sinica FACHB-800 TaxID=1357546 RepID=A0A975T8Z7_9NOST|nr:DUF4129 domain-containing protein [Richelia sinica]MBD2666751.1 DUF4129 domain-containing protein [Richelia sinica FACHB-800]QXE24249.1 hypothetical protein B6N60_02953 [Richelia sinica FACHB-800]